MRMHRIARLFINRWFVSARILIAGIEAMHMIRKNQFANIKDRTSSAANKFYAFAY